VTPLSELIATAERGLVYGNRGCLHDRNRVVRRAFATTRWIACQLEFRGRWRGPLMAPGRYTELFFLDEATALAAGHRPCAECRRADYKRLTEIWEALHPGQLGADAIDRQLHSERFDPGSKSRRLHRKRYRDLPDGAFVLHESKPCLVLGDRLLTWSPAGYVQGSGRPTDGTAAAITSPSLMELLRQGWSPLVPLLHPSAKRLNS
jgi:hypothetical protein